MAVGMPGVASAAKAMSVRVSVSVFMRKRLTELVLLV